MTFLSCHQWFSGWQPTSRHDSTRLDSASCIRTENWNSNRYWHCLLPMPAIQPASLACRRCYPCRCRGCCCWCAENIKLTGSKKMSRIISVHSMQQPHKHRALEMAPTYCAIAEAAIAAPTPGFQLLAPNCCHVVF